MLRKCASGPEISLPISGPEGLLHNIGYSMWSAKGAIVGMLEIYFGQMRAVEDQCSMLRNNASGPGFGRILIGRASQSALRPAECRPEGRFCCNPDLNPAEILPGRQISGPEALLRNIG